MGRGENKTQPTAASVEAYLGGLRTRDGRRTRGLSPG